MTHATLMQRNDTQPTHPRSGRQTSSHKRTRHSCTSPNYSHAKSAVRSHRATTTAPFKRLRICLATIVKASSNPAVRPSEYVSLEDRYGSVAMSEEETTLCDGLANEPRAIKIRGSVTVSSGARREGSNSNASSSVVLSSGAHTPEISRSATLEQYEQQPPRSQNSDVMLQSRRQTALCACSPTAVAIGPGQVVSIGHKHAIRRNLSSFDDLTCSENFEKIFHRKVE